MTQPQDSLTVDGFIDLLSDQTPAPGGGAGLALAAALAAALTRMVAGLTVNRRKYADVAAEIQPIYERVVTLRDELLDAVYEDQIVYQQVMSLLQVQNERNSETAVRAIEDALLAAARVPLKVATLAAEVAEMALLLAQKGNVHAAADAAAAAFLAQAAVHGSALNVRANLKQVANEKLKTSWTNQTTRLVQKVDELTAATTRAAESRLFTDPPPGRRPRKKRD